jgi:hypothetical protein
MAKMTKRQKERFDRFVPNRQPRWLRVYDNGGTEGKGTIDRYTVVFTGRYGHKTAGEHWVLGMNGAPFSPQGFCQHSTYPNQVDRPTYGHLGRKIGFPELPEDCQVAALGDYLYLWDLTDKEDSDHAMARKILGFKKN